jgi:uroporphyrinogen-III synthase
MKRLIILRPEPGASASVARAQSLGLDAVAIPLFEVVPVPWTVVRDDFTGIVATSANAFRHGGPGLRALLHLPVHAVGEATADAARKAGFAVAGVGDGGAEDLTLPGGDYLHLAGQHHVAMPQSTAVVVYESRLIDPAPALIVDGAVIAVHSARAGARLTELVAQRASASIVAISAAASTACGSGWHAVAVAAIPREAAMLALARELCQNHDR